MRILITGITGRIGANLAATLDDAGYEVVGLVWPGDASTAKLEPYGFELHEGSVTSADDVRRVSAGVEAIYHLGAAFQAGGPFTEDDYFDINIRGTYNVMEASRHIDCLRHLVFASTDAVLPKYPPEGVLYPIREDVMERRPNGWYALSKAAGEEMCLGYQITFAVPVTVLRFCYVAGAGEIIDYPEFYLRNVGAEHRRELGPIDDPDLVVLRDVRGRSHKKHIADVRDIVHGLACVLDREDAVGQTIQLAGPCPFTWEEAMPYLAERLGVGCADIRVDGTPTFYEFDLTKAHRLLEYRPQFDIFRMIDDALAFRRGNDIGMIPT